MRTCLLENVRVDKSNLTVTNDNKMRPQRVIHNLFILPRKRAKDFFEHSHLIRNKEGY